MAEQASQPDLQVSSGWFNISQSATVRNFPRRTGKDLLFEKTGKIFVAGHRGMVGSAIHRRLLADGYGNIVTQAKKELGLRDTPAVRSFFSEEKPEYVFLAAARVGGIMANMQSPGEFLYDNLMIQNNVIHQSFLAGVKKVCFLGSSCIYPRACPQPMREEHLMTGKLEPTNEGYAVAKLAGVKMMECSRRQYGLKGSSPIPCNLYGTNDSFYPRSAHVLSSLVGKFVDAVDEAEGEVTVWGTGVARREFLHVDDLADAVLFLMTQPDPPEIINVGSGFDVSIRELAGRVAHAAGFGGKLLWDASKPDGMPRKCLDVARMTRLGFRPRIGLEEGIAKTVAEYRDLKKGTRKP
jgi:GDP-L-fucose synthase